MTIKNTLTTSVDIRVKQKDGSVIEDTVVNVPTEIVQMPIDGIENIGGSSVLPIGYCIYCDAVENLTKEHIIPHGLSGTAVLQKASCPRCSKITGDFERKVLRGPMVEVRKLLCLQSRSNHKKSKLNAELTLVIEGNEVVVQIPMNEYPIILSLPTFGAPNYLTGVKSLGINISGITAISFGPRPEELLQRFNAQKITIPEPTSEPIAFARMLAKIAYCFAIKNNELIKLKVPALCFLRFLARVTISVIGLAHLTALCRHTMAYFTALQSTPIHKKACY